LHDVTNRYRLVSNDLENLQEKFNKDKGKFDDIINNKYDDETYILKLE